MKLKNSEIYAALCLAVLLGFIVGLGVNRDPPTPTLNQEFILGTKEETTKVNLTTATFEQLKLLPGIGKVKAGLILDYREKHGISTIEELIKIEGIGPETIEKLLKVVEIK